MLINCEMGNFKGNQLQIKSPKMRLDLSIGWLKANVPACT
jgi:hypothetical protein